MAMCSQQLTSAIALALNKIYASSYLLIDPWI
jgi:hypothetical protein